MATAASVKVLPAASLRSFFARPLACLPDDLDREHQSADFRPCMHGRAIDERQDEEIRLNELSRAVHDDIGRGNERFADSVCFHIWAHEIQQLDDCPLTPTFALSAASLLAGLRVRRFRGHGFARRGSVGLGG